ncbi:MAG: hypothetical protein QXF56_04385 [Candidatus Micrarchaeia archaeon]
MKTFEGRAVSGSEVESRAVVFLMYLLRAVSLILIFSMLFYIPARILGGYEATFREFILANLVLLICFVAFLFAIQLLFYFYRLRKGVKMKRSIAGIIVGYALPLIGIAAVLWVVYAIGAI